MKDFPKAFISMTPRLLEASKKVFRNTHTYDEYVINNTCLTRTAQYTEVLLKVPTLKGLSH